MPQNWCFWTVVLEKTLESPLDRKESQPVHPEGDQSWVFIGRIDVEAETPILWTWCEELTYWKRPWCWERLRAGEEGDKRGWVGWMASPIQSTEFEQTLGDSGGQGSLVCCSSWGGRVRHDLVCYLLLSTWYSVTFISAALWTPLSLLAANTDEWAHQHSKKGFRLSIVGYN